jgi:hypothetical protein
MAIETQSFVGRTLRPWWKKVNPLWWFANDDDPLPPDWELPGKPMWLRVIAWYIRNPLSNFADYVIGVCDRNYSVIGTAPLYATTWADVPESNRTGFKWSLIKTRIPLPFVSYTGKRVLWYAGWQKSGNFKIKFNLVNSKVQVV